MGSAEGFTSALRTSSVYGSLLPWALHVFHRYHLSQDAGYDTYAKGLQPLVERLLKK
jgi:hypothetical protein